MASFERKTNKAAYQHLKELAALKNPVAKIGWFQGNNYPDGTPVGYVASIQEHGAPEAGIEPRPFIRPMLRATRNHWKDLFKSGGRAILAGNETWGTVLEKLGGDCEGRIKESIVNFSGAPLAASTLASRARRGKGTKPLLDTTRMYSTVTHKVEAS